MDTDRHPFLGPTLQGQGRERCDEEIRGGIAKKKKEMLDWVSNISVQFLVFLLVL